MSALFSSPPLAFAMFARLWIPVGVCIVAGASSDAVGASFVAFSSAVGRLVVGDGLVVVVVVVGDPVSFVGMSVGNIDEGEGGAVGLALGDTVATMGESVGDADKGFVAGDAVGSFTGLLLDVAELGLSKHWFRLLSTGAQYCPASHPRQLSDPSRIESTGKHSLH